MSKGVNQDKINKIYGIVYFLNGQILLASKQ